MCFGGLGGAYVEGNAEDKVEGNAGGIAEGNAKGPGRLCRSSRPSRHIENVYLKA